MVVWILDKQSELFHNTYIYNREVAGTYFITGRASHAQRLSYPTIHTFLADRNHVFRRNRREEESSWLSCSCMNVFGQSVSVDWKIKAGLCQESGLWLRTADLRGLFCCLVWPAISERCPGCPYVHTSSNVVSSHTEEACRTELELFLIEASSSNFLGNLSHDLKSH